MTLETPEVDGSNWTVDRPFTNKRYSFDSGSFVFVIRDVGGPFLWRLHARSKATGEILTFGRDDHGNNQDGLDGLQTLFGAATRMVLGRVRDSDEWKSAPHPHLYTNIFADLP